MVQFPFIESVSSTATNIEHRHGDRRLIICLHAIVEKHHGRREKDGAVVGKSAGYAIMTQVHDCFLRETPHGSSVGAVHLEGVSVGALLHVMDYPPLVEIHERIAAEHKKHGYYSYNCES